MALRVWKAEISMSDVLVINENHLEMTPDGKCWSSGGVDYHSFARFLNVFDKVYVAIRIREVEKKGDKFNIPCSGEGVHYIQLIDFVGPIDYLRKSFKINRQIKEVCNIADCAVIRIPNAVSTQFLRYLDRRKPYVLEVAGDPWEHMAPGMYKSPIRPIFRVLLTMAQKKYCMKANGVSYVTKKALQSRYPCYKLRHKDDENHFATHYSSVNISDSDGYEPKIYEKKSKYVLIHSSNVFTTYSKGHIEAIKVVKNLNDCGYDVSIQFIGDGPLRSEFYECAKVLGIDDKIEFLGRMNDRKEIYESLRNADIFLFPSHSEGLPKVVIEAMHVGTPSVATNVGGIPELLDKEYISNVGDIARMTKIVKQLLDHPEELSRLSQVSIERSKEYSEYNLQKKRDKFYKRLEECIKLG